MSTFERFSRSTARGRGLLRAARMMATQGTATMGKQKGDLYTTAITLFTHRHAMDMYERQVTT